MAPYTFRVDLEKVDRDQFAIWVQRFGSYVGFIEDVEGENIHAHVVIHSDDTVKKIRNAFRWSFKESTGNESYSLKYCTDVERYYQYICKGKEEGTMPELWIRHGIEYTDDWIRTKHEAYWAENKKTRGKRKRGGV